MSLSGPNVPIKMIFLMFINILFSASLVYSRDCNSVVTDLKYKEVDTSSFCREKPCVVKCCGEDEVVYSFLKDKKTIINICANIADVKQNLTKRGVEDFSGVSWNFSSLDIYDNDIYKNVTISTKKFTDFTFLQRSMFMESDKCSLGNVVTDNFKLLEKGVLVMHNPNHYEYWSPTETADFCVDLQVGKKGKKAVSFPYYKIKTNDSETEASKITLIAITMTISAFFLLLILVVYCLLHQLRNIQGMLLSAYVSSLMCSYGLKAGYLFYGLTGGHADCTVLCEIIYFFTLASFFWLKLMSFDIWWTFRGSRKLRKIHRRGINVKFLIYASYAFGVPAAITIFASIMDKHDLPRHIVKPFFSSCLVSDMYTPIMYLYIPLIILTGINCLLFIMTVYNIWLIKRNLAKFDKSTVKRNKNTQDRFVLYIKLFSIMGVSWVLEFVQVSNVFSSSQGNFRQGMEILRGTFSFPLTRSRCPWEELNTLKTYFQRTINIQMPEDSTPVWLFAILTSYNMLIGVIIFFLFVFKTNIFLMLCKRFNVENRWTRRSQIDNSTRSQDTKNSKTFSRSKSTTDSEVEEGLRRNEKPMKIRNLNED